MEQVSKLERIVRRLDEKLHKTHTEVEELRGKLRQTEGENEDLQLELERRTVEAESLRQQLEALKSGGTAIDDHSKDEITRLAESLKRSEASVAETEEALRESESMIEDLTVKNEVLAEARDRLTSQIEEFLKLESAEKQRRLDEAKVHSALEEQTVQLKSELALRERTIEDLAAKIQKLDSMILKPTEQVDKSEQEQPVFLSQEIMEECVDEANQLTSEESLKTSVSGQLLRLMYTANFASVVRDRLNRRNQLLRAAKYVDEEADSRYLLEVGQYEGTVLADKSGAAGVEDALLNGRESSIRDLTKICGKLELCVHALDLLGKDSDKLVALRDKSLHALGALKEMRQEERGSEKLAIPSLDAFLQNLLERSEYGEVNDVDLLIPEDANKLARLQVGQGAPLTSKKLGAKKKDKKKKQAPLPVMQVRVPSRKESISLQMKVSLLQAKLEKLHLDERQLQNATRSLEEETSRRNQVEQQAATAEELRQELEKKLAKSNKILKTVGLEATDYQTRTNLEEELGSADRSNLLNAIAHQRDLIRKLTTAKDAAAPPEWLRQNLRRPNYSAQDGLQLEPLRRRLDDLFDICNEDKLSRLELEGRILRNVSLIKGGLTHR